MSPNKRSPPRGVLLGRCLLQADGHSKGMVKSIEHLLLSCTSSDMFLAAVVEDREMEINADKALLVWDLYKLV